MSDLKKIVIDLEDSDYYKEKRIEKLTRVEFAAWRVVEFKIEGLYPDYVNVMQKLKDELV